MKKPIFAILIIAVLAGGFFLIFRQKSSQNSPEVKGNSNSSVILFYGETCPHCKKVEEWLEENPEIEKKSGIVKKEVYYNQENSRQLGEKAKECQINEAQGIGVPFLYAEGKCIVGDQPIIDFLSQKYR